MASLQNERLALRLRCKCKSENSLAQTKQVLGKPSRCFFTGSAKKLLHLLFFLIEYMIHVKKSFPSNLQLFVLFKGHVDERVDNNQQE